MFDMEQNPSIATGPLAVAIASKLKLTAGHQTHSQIFETFSDHSFLPMRLA